jgi:opacity protein-like surface antigen
LKNLLFASATAVIMAWGAVPAWAEPPTGLYSRGDFGAAFVAPMQFTNTSSADPLFGTDIIPTQRSTSTFLVDGGLGWRFGPVLRIDGTVGYLAPFHFDGVQSNAAHFQGHVSSIVGMANGYVDIGGLFPSAMPGWINPFVVGSVGIALNRLGPTDDEFFVSSAAESGTGAVHASFAWGAGAGFGIPVNERTTIDVTYKYTDLGEVRTGTSEVFLGTVFTSAPAKASLRTNTVTLGARVGF